MSEWVEYLWIEIRLLLAEPTKWWVFLVAFILTIVLRFVLWKAVKILFNIVFFVLIYGVIILSLSYWVS